jgi:hypothetical protein
VFWAKGGKAVSDNITLPRAAEQVRKALELALESQFAPDDVECEHGMHYRDCSNNVCVMRDCKAALAALDAALAEPRPEPVAWMYVNSEGECEQIEYETPPAGDDSITPLYAAPPEPKPQECWCHKCNSGWLVAHMIVCPTCGNKRCPRASDHELPCTDSNEPGQPGSVYALVAPEPDAKREPATREQVFAAFDLSGAVDFWNYCYIWREAERFHGIKKEDK